MWPVVTDRVAWSVTLVSPAKPAELVEVPFGLRTPLVVPGNHVLDGGPDLPWEWENFGG